MSLWVDDRYRGAHGIGRYATEVLSRLSVPWHPLGLNGSPHSPLDAFRSLPEDARGTTVYSPGYGAFVRARRHVLTIHDLIQLRMPWSQRVKFVAYYAGPVRAVVRRAGVVLTESETSANDIRAWVRDDDVRVVNAGIGCSAAFQPEGPAANGHPYVLFVGNLRRHKNLDVVLRALAIAPELRLRAVVPAREADEAATIARALGVAGRVEWLTGVDDEQLAALYRGAAVTAMPSTDEGFGLPALESISCGTPVAYWRGCAAVAETVEDRGWALERAHDADAWAEVFVEAARSPRRVAPPTGRYDWDRTAAIVSDTLREAMG